MDMYIYWTDERANEFNELENEFLSSLTLSAHTEYLMMTKFMLNYIVI